MSRGAGRCGMQSPTTCQPAPKCVTASAGNMGRHPYHNPPPSPHSASRPSPRPSRGKQVYAHNTQLCATDGRTAPANGCRGVLGARREDSVGLACQEKKDHQKINARAWPPTVHGTASRSCLADGRPPCSTDACRTWPPSQSSSHPPPGSTCARHGVGCRRP